MRLRTGLLCICLALVTIAHGKTASASEVALDTEPTSWVVLEILKKFPSDLYHYVLPGNGLSDISRMLIAESLIEGKPSPVSYFPLSEFKDEAKYSQPKEMWMNEWEELNARFEEFVPKIDKTYLVMDVYNQGRTLRNLSRNISSLGHGEYRNFEILGINSQQSTYDYSFYKQEERLSKGETKIFNRLKTPWAFFNKNKMQAASERFSKRAPLLCSMNCCLTQTGAVIQKMKSTLLHDRSGMQPRLSRALK